MASTIRRLIAAYPDMTEAWA